MKSILLVKKLLGLVEMTSGLVSASFSLPEWQAVKMIFFAPCIRAKRRSSHLQCQERVPSFVSQILITGPVPGIEPATSRVKRSTVWANPAAVKLHCHKISTADYFTYNIEANRTRIFKIRAIIEIRTFGSAPHFADKFTAFKKSQDRLVYLKCVLFRLLTVKSRNLPLNSCEMR